MDRVVRARFAVWLVTEVDGCRTTVKPQGWKVGPSIHQGESSMRKQAGFTLIELIAVIVILAILAVVAIPQYVDLRADAANAAAAGVGGAVASGSALNYARGVASGQSAVVIKDCTSEAQLAGVLSTGGTTLPKSGSVTGY